MSEQNVYLNGEFLPSKEAFVPALDRGFLLGDGLFETMRVYDGKIFAVEQHLERLFASLNTLNIRIPESRSELGQCCAALCESSTQKNCALRITITRGAVQGALGLIETDKPTRLIHCRPMNLPSTEDYEKGIEVILSGVLFAKPPTLYAHKTINYLGNLAAKQTAIDAGAYEALMQNEKSEIIEGATSNVFAVFGDNVVTPSLNQGALPGITRATCIGIFAEQGINVIEKSLPASEILRADELWLTNSVIEVLPVRSANKRPIGQGKPGTISRLLMKKYRDVIRKKLQSR